MNAEPPPARSRWPRRAARAALAAAAALLCTALALGGLALALSRGFERERLRGWLEAGLARALGARVELAALEGPLYPELELRGLRVAAADGSRLAAARIAVRCGPLCGWREGRLELEQLRLEQLAIELSPAAAAKLQGGGEPAGERAALPLPVRIGTLELAGAELALPYASWPPPRPAPAAGADAGGADAAKAPAAPAGAAALPAELAAERSSPEPAPLTRVALDGALHELWLLPRGVRWPSGGALQLRAGPLELRGRRIARVQAQLELGAGALRAAPLELESDAGALRQGELRLELGGDAAQPGAGALVAGLELRAQLDALDVGAWSGLPALRSALAGALELRARAAPEHGWAQPQLELQAQLRGAAAGAPLDALELRAHAQGARWELEHARARGLAISLEASGAGDAAGVSRLALQGEVARLDAVLPPALAPWLGGGRARVQAQAAGAWRELVGTAALHAEQLRLGTGAPGALEARLRASGGRIELEQLDYRGPARAAGRAPESLHARGAWGTAGELALRADLAGIDLARLPPALRPALPLAGALSGWLELAGTRAQPQLRAQLAATRLRVGPLPESRAQLALQAAAGVAEGRLALDPKGPAELSASFALPYSPAPPWPDPRALFHQSGARLDLQGQALELAPLLALAGQDAGLASGALGVELHVSGEPSGPRLAGRLQLSGVSARSAGLGGGPLGPADGELRFEQLAPWHPAGPPLRLSGELALLRGTERPPVALELALRLHHWLDWPRLELQIEQLQASSGAQRMEFSGELHGLRAEPLRVRVQGLELAPWLPQQPRPAGGRLDAQLELRGPLFAGPALSGALTLAEPHYGEARADRLALEFGTNAGRFQASGHLEALGTLAARASLELPGPLGTRSLAELLADPEARLELRSERLDLRWLEPLAPVWLSDLEGALSADLQVRGAPDELALSGSLELEGAAAQVPLLSQRIGPLQASAHLQNRALVLDQLHVESPEGGVLQARGELALLQLRPSALDLRVQLANFPVSSSGVASFATTGAVELAGPLPALVFSGDLSVREGRFAAPERGDPVFKEIRVLQASGAAPQFREGLAGNSLWEGARGRLRIAIPEDTWLRGRGAELEVTGEVELRKQPGQSLRYFGGLEVRRGSYQLGRQLLRVERGSLQFTGSEQLDPLLDVLAAAELREHRVEVQLRGPLSEPLSELRSEPPLPRDDVLALLLFGIPSAELEQDRAAALSSVLALLGSELAVNDLRTRVARVLPFDTLGLETDASGTGTRLEVGRYVGKGIFVSYGRSVTGPTPQDAVGLEWRLTPSVSLKSETSSEGHTGADLIWRKDY